LRWRCQWIMCVFIAAGLPATAMLPASAGEDCNDDGIPDDQPGLGLLFFDTFSWTVLDSSRWALIDAATVDDVGLAEPSGLYSLRLNGNTYAGDAIESIAIDLSNAEYVFLSYQWQRTGGGESPEGGDDLFVEYRDADGYWQALAQYVGEGADMTVFMPESIELPGAAYHANFALRFRNNATVGLYDDWFIDDVYLMDFVPDCNNNGVPDDCDIDEGFSLDCNANGIPDECDIADGISEDCNENDVPDECDAVSGFSEDVNGDFIPDECQDCNGNSILDPIDIAAETSADCNQNGQPDECDLDAGLDTDCDGGGVPDACDIAARHYLLDDGTMEAKIGASISSGIIWLNQFGVEPGGEDAAAIEIAWGAATTGQLAKLAIWTDPDNDGDPSDAVLIQQINSVPVENPETNRFVRTDIPRTRLGEVGDVFYVGAYMPPLSAPYPAALDISPPAMQMSWVAFGDNLENLEDNPYPPVLIDTYGSPGNFMLRCVSEDRDCNDNGVFDECDVADLDSYDNNLNGVPDECEQGSTVGLELVPDAECYGPAEQLTIEIWMNDAPESVVGGQFFLDYDDERLELVSIEPAGAPSAFTEQVYECSMQEGAGGGVCMPVIGALDYAVGINPVEGGGASGDAKMAVLTFQTLQPICTGEGLLTWRTDEVVRLGSESNTLLVPLLLHMELGDFAPPDLTVPPDLLFEIDQIDQCQITADLGDPSAVDDCSDQEDIVITWRRSDGHLSLEDPYDVVDSPITITWQAEDECGYSSEGLTTVTVILLGDLDYDHDVDLSDLAQLLAFYGTTSGATYEQGDLNHDGDVDLSDLATLLAMYSASCS